MWATSEGSHGFSHCLLSLQLGEMESKNVSRRVVGLEQLRKIKMFVNIMGHVFQYT
jgi:hypothetical protein